MGPILLLNHKIIILRLENMSGNVFHGSFIVINFRKNNILAYLCVFGFNFFKFSILKLLFLDGKVNLSILL